MTYRECSEEGQENTEHHCCFHHLCSSSGEHRHGFVVGLLCCACCLRWFEKRLDENNDEFEEAEVIIFIIGRHDPILVREAQMVSLNPWLTISWYRIYRHIHILHTPNCGAPYLFPSKHE